MIKPFLKAEQRPWSAAEVITPRLGKKGWVLGGQKLLFPSGQAGAPPVLGSSSSSFKDTPRKWENVDPLWPDYKVSKRLGSSFYFWRQLSHTQSKLRINSAAQTKLLHGPVTACRLPGSKFCFQLKAARNEWPIHKGNVQGIRKKIFGVLTKGGACFSYNVLLSCSFFGGYFFFNVVKYI